MASMIRVSDDNAAEVIWRSLGGDSSIRKMIRTCRLTDTRVYPGWWSLTQISSRDMARLGACLAPGPGKLLSRAASRQLLDLMRTVEPVQRLRHPAGPAGRRGRPGRGEERLDRARRHRPVERQLPGVWGPGERWVLAVTLRYPIRRGPRLRRRRLPPGHRRALPLIGARALQAPSTAGRTG